MNPTKNELAQAVADELSNEGFIDQQEALKRIEERKTATDVSPAAIKTARINSHDFIYRQVLHQIMYWGEDRGNRTGIDARSCFGAMLKFDLREGTFPLLTLRHIPIGSIVAELIGFLRGYTNAAQFRELGTKIWDQNANENKPWLNNPNRKGVDDLGRIYGAQWRDWRSPAVFKAAKNFSTDEKLDDEGEYLPGATVDQFKHLLHCLRHNRTDRRMIVSAWNPGELDQMALPPCHMMFQCYVTHDNHLDLVWYQRSVDSVLGAPFNIASYALLVQILCGLVPDLKPGTLTAMWGDYHIYHNHFDGVKLMLSRSGNPPPTLEILWPTDNPAERQHWLETAPAADVMAAFQLTDYYPEPKIKFEMAV